MNKTLLPSRKALTSIVLTLSLAWRCEALVFCVTNAVDVHQSAPTGAWANSGWHESAPIDLYMGAVIASNALLTAKHLWHIGVGKVFTAEGSSRTVTARVNDAGSDLAVLFFTPPVTNIARINIETNDIGSVVVLQGRGMERGAVVVTGGRTNGWQWDASRNWSIRRWGVNRYIGATEDGIYAMAAFDDNGDPDECMTSGGDSGGPGFIRSGSGWKLATINFAVGPRTFATSTNAPITEFDASLFDIAGLYYKSSGNWVFMPTNASPAPCLMFNTRTVARLDWLTNAVPGLAFPADLGVAWRCETNQPSALQAATGIWLEVVATNAGPYAARDVALDFDWPAGLHVRGGSATHGGYATNRWTLPLLADGTAAVLRLDAVVWRARAGWATNRVVITRSDKPDGFVADNEAELAIHLPQTAAQLLIR